MYFAEVLERSSCEKSQLKSWLKDKVVIPVKPGNGPGSRALFDDTNLLCACIALRLNAMHITVAKYSGAFGDLHNAFRSFSSLEWHKLVVVMSPESVQVQKLPHGHKLTATDIAVTIEVNEVLKMLKIEPSEDKQLPFYLGLALTV